MVLTGRVEELLISSLKMKEILSSETRCYSQAKKDVRTNSLKKQHIT
jgi:hypothetical protein